jgi:hypothetical protein
MAHISGEASQSRQSFRAKADIPTGFKATNKQLHPPQWQSSQSCRYCFLTLHLPLSLSATA